MSTIRAIGFDFGGVIGGVGTTGGNFNQQICATLDIDEATYKNVYFGMNHLINTGEIKSWHEFWKLFLDKLNKPDKYQAVMNLSDEAEKHLEIIDQSMLALVTTLRENGYKVGLLSNTTLAHGKKLRAAGLSDYFDAFRISAETKLMKPDPKAFNDLATALGIDIHEMAFVDDAEKSLSTAKETGFIPVLFTGRETLKAQLTELGVRVNG